MVGVNEIFFQCSYILLKVILYALKGKGKMNEEFLENKINRNWIIIIWDTSTVSSRRKICSIKYQNQVKNALNIQLKNQKKNN